MLNENLINYILGKDTSELRSKFMRILRELHSDFSAKYRRQTEILKNVLGENFLILPTAVFNSGELGFIKEQTNYNKYNCHCNPSNHGIVLYLFLEYLCTHNCYNNKNLLDYFLRKQSTLTDHEMNYHKTLFDLHKSFDEGKVEWDAVDENYQLKDAFIKYYGEEFDSVKRYLRFGNYCWLNKQNHELTHIKQFINFLTGSKDASEVESD